MTRHLVLGYGEVGKALHGALDFPTVGNKADALDCHVTTPTQPSGLYDGIHVCLPFVIAATFEAAISDALRLYARKTTIVVIHSTVPLGTCRALGARLGYRVVSSPVRGVHPNLREGLLTFPKWCGGPGAELVAMWLTACGMNPRVFPDSETPEAMKLWDTTQYGWQIVLAKEIAAWCAREGVAFDQVYRQANYEYNAGYADLGKPHVVRPALKDMPGPIGGHCVMPNLALIGSCFIANIIAAADSRYRRDDTRD